jgi:RNA polymerase-binding transcription factor DksA
MPRTLRSRSKAVATSATTITSARKTHAQKHEELRRELIRQRAALLELTNLSRMAEREPDTSSDLADQAASDQEQTLAFQVKTRMVAKLGRIDPRGHSL